MAAPARLEAQGLDGFQASGLGKSSRLRAIYPLRVRMKRVIVIGAFFDAFQRALSVPRASVVSLVLLGGGVHVSASGKGAPKICMSCHDKLDLCFVRRLSVARV